MEIKLDPVSLKSDSTRPHLRRLWGCTLLTGNFKLVLFFVFFTTLCVSVL